MSCDQFLIILNILVALIGVLFVGITIYEYWKLRNIRENFQEFQSRMAADHFRSQKATHRVLASYSAKSADEKIALLKSAVDIDPTVFNAYNALGYAWLEQDEVLQAIQAFNKAIEHHPEEKAGYFDLASLYLKENKQDLCLEYLQKAAIVDPSAKDDLQDNPQFAQLSNNSKYQALLKSQ